MKAKSGGELTAPEDASAVLQELAETVCKRRMATAAVFFLELHKPLTSVFHSMAVMSAPLLTPLFGAAKTRSVMKVLESRENVEKLIVYIESYERSKRA